MSPKFASALILPFALALAACAGGGSANVTGEVKTADNAPPPPPPAAPEGAPADVGTAHIKGDHIEIDKQILFATDSDQIDEGASTTVLNDLIWILRAHPEVVHLRIVGHTDTRGSAAHNKDLSQRRAAAVAKYINGHGLPNVKIETEGKGPEQPLCKEDTDACHDKNRRVEFITLQ